jgi:hypothetical protein
MPIFICEFCQRQFPSQYLSRLHIEESVIGAACRKALARKNGNSNVVRLQLIAGEDGDPGHLEQAQEKQAKKRKLDPRLFGSYTNTNMIRLKVEHGISTRFYNDLIATIKDPRFDPKSITATSAYLVRKS